MKLHLGCGGKYLKGYVNIDFPPDKHTVQKKSVADKYADILDLSYRKESVDEIRSHHLFEHFTRPIALALLASWNSWLKIGGILRIEVPDFDKTASRVLSPFSQERQKYVALRHIFGSQEADWAAHYEGWSPARLKKLLKSFGFKVKRIKLNNWKGTFNFEVIAMKSKTTMLKESYYSHAKKHLSLYLIDDSPSERRMLEVWLKQYLKQINKTWAK